jgi:DNA-damage-inducible protein J
MTIDTVAHANVEQEILEQASAIYAAAGMSVDEAFRVLLVRTVAENALPFDPITPNQETIEAMLEARRGGLPTFDTLEELMAALHAED